MSVTEAGSIQLVQPYRGTVVYSRKINQEARGGYKYENEEAQVSISFDVTPDDEVATVQAADDAFASAKAVVLGQLGVAFEYDAAQGRVIETTAAAPPKVDAVARVTRAFTDPTTGEAPQAVQSGSGNNGGPACPDCGGGMYDNRAQNLKRKQEGKKPTPDYKCKNYKPADGGCDGHIWPPKEGR